VAAWQSAAAGTDNLFYPGIILERSGLTGKNLCCRVNIGREKKKNGQPDAGTPVHAPVYEWQDKDEKSLISQKR